MPSPSGKARVCKTLIGGSIPPGTSKFFFRLNETRQKCQAQVFAVLRASFGLVYLSMRGSVCSVILKFLRTEGAGVLRLFAFIDGSLANLLLK